MRLLSLIATVSLLAACDRPPAGVLRSAFVSVPVDLGCVQSVLEATPGVEHVRLSVWKQPDDVRSLVQSFDVDYAGERGALQIISVAGVGQKLQQLVLRGELVGIQPIVDRVRPLMERVERRLRIACRLRFPEGVEERCTAVHCPEIDDASVAPSPDVDEARNTEFDRA